MTFNLLNPLMLLGLIGLSLPIIAHLISRRKYDIVQWGAMQFLELGRNARRKLRLEQLLLLLLRMGLIALVVLALARPWAQGGFLTNFISKENRDVVFVIDGSYSMGWEGTATTPHKEAVAWARHFLEDLQPGDTVALIDARDQARIVIESPTRDFGLVRQQLDELPPPAGSSNLAEATRRAAQILSRTSNLSREVIVLTDGQARGWRADEAGLWMQYDDLLKQPTVRPRTWVVTVGDQNVTERTNFHVERLQLSRELTAVNYPLRIKTKVRYSGGTTATSRRVYLEVDGQRLAEKTMQVRLQPEGEASVEFEYQFGSPGSRLVSVVLDPDNLPGDNRADAAVTVAEALPVLLVDGDPQPLEVVRGETFFLRNALTPESNPAPWVRASVVAREDFDRELAKLASYEAVVLANVPRLTEKQAEALREYVAAGGGLFIGLGNRVEKDEYNRLLFESGEGLSPVSLESIEENEDETARTVRVVGASLELPWMTRFKPEHEGGFTDARFSHWWKVTLAEADDREEAKRAEAATKTDVSGASEPQISAPIVAARLNTGDPLIVTRTYGRGGVVLMTSALDADWSTLPAKEDYVPFLHETIFHLASSKSTRNVDVGTPLVLLADPDLQVGGYAFFGPGDTMLPPTPAGTERNRQRIRLDDTRLPGVYAFRRKGNDDKPEPASPAEYFVVNFDRGESDLVPLSDSQRKQLAEDDRMAFVPSRSELKQAMFQDASRSELWHVLLLVFLGILVFEVVMTRRMVQGGHAAVDEAEESSEPTSFEHLAATEGSAPSGRG